MKLAAIAEALAYKGKPGWDSTDDTPLHGGHCVLLYDHAGMDHLRQWVHDGEHVLFFRTPEEFRQKLELMRADPGLGVKIGEAARSLVLERGWTASAWMRECLALVGN